MDIGIGIFAHNEEHRIEATLASLREQDLLDPARNPGVRVEIVVLANGCADGTAVVADAALRRDFSSLAGVTARVEVLPEPGKSRTWNAYVHGVANPAAEVLILMDGDIRLLGASTLRNLVRALQEHPEANVSVDVILKDVALKGRHSVRERMSLAASELTLGGRPKLAGSLYAARGDALRSIWMPVGLLVEDGYLKAMLCTDSFTRPDTPSRLIRAEDAAHAFEAVTDPRALFRHEVRLLVGSAMNFILFGHIATHVRSTGLNGGHLVRQWNEHDPEWFARLVEAALTAKGWWQAPTGFIVLPFRQLRDLPPSRAVRRFPAAMVRAGFNLAAALAANRALRRRAFRW